MVCPSCYEFRINLFFFYFFETLFYIISARIIPVQQADFDDFRRFSFGCLFINKKKITL